MKYCYHCGDEIIEETTFDDKSFCCEGCKTVYQILDHGDLAEFYELNEDAGFRPNKVQNYEYDFLELEEIKAKLISFQEEGIVKTQLSLPQIHCSSCLYVLERIHQINTGIKQCHVDFTSKKAIITYNEEEITLREVAELLAKIGYAPDIKLKDYEKEETPKKDYSLIIKIGVVGFCFGNIMLLSFPEYLGLENTDKQFQTLFNGLNFVLALPVLIYGARDYLVGAYKSLRTGNFLLDVPISIGIVALFGRSAYEIFSQTGPGYFDSFAGLIFFLLIGKWFQTRTYNQLNFERDYSSYFPIAVSKEEGNDLVTVPLKSVQVGDRICIRNNELIPADAVLMDGTTQIDYSFVTGESKSIRKNKGEKLYAGGKNKGKNIIVKVTEEVNNSYLTNLWKTPIFNKERKGFSFADSVSKYFTVAILLIGTISGLVWFFLDPSQWVFIVTSVFIVACPCAIALSEPFTYSNAQRLFSKRDFYLRNSGIISILPRITDIVFDKTGTLTELDRGELTWEGEKLSNEEERIIYSIVKNSSHPLSCLISTSLEHYSSLNIEDYEEVVSSGIQATVNGKTYKIGNDSFVGMSSTDRRTRVNVAVDGEYRGVFIIGNKYRARIESLIISLGGRYRLHVISGDNDAEQDRLLKLFGEKNEIVFNAKPQDKLDYVKSLQDEGCKVLMLGDGLNDAGALKQSDFGISVVEDSFSFSPSSDAILNGNELVNLSELLAFGRFSYATVKRSYAFSLAYNLTGICFAVLGLLTPLFAAILMPLSSISVVFFTTISTNLYAYRKLNKKASNKREKPYPSANK